MERKDRSYEQINREIVESKKIIEMNEGKIAAQMNKFQTPQKTVQGQRNESTATNPESASRVNGGGSVGGVGGPVVVREEEIANYIKNMKRLCGSLQQKQYMSQVQYQKSLLNYSYEIERLKRELKEEKDQVAMLVQQNEQKTGKIKEMGSQIAELQKVIREREETISKLEGELGVKRTENTQLKLQNKRYRADNKVIMNHIDRLTNEAKAQVQNKTTLQQRQMRVMRSLYQDPRPNLQREEATRRYEVVNDMSNRMLVDEATDRNGQLKRLIRKLNEEIELLKREKEMLIQECRQKTLNLESQKMIVRMSEEGSEKLNGVVNKMGEKIVSLEELNQTLRAEIKKLEESDVNIEENYYRQTKIKAGQFYYKK